MNLSCPIGIIPVGQYDEPVHFRRRHPRIVRLVSALLMGVYLVASLGVLPSPHLIAEWLGHVNPGRYPCEDCGCGCSSARECWTACCCHNSRQRLIWAIENGVSPPEDLQFSDEAWIDAANAVQAGSAHCALCVARIKDELRRGVATARTSAEPGDQSNSCCAPGPLESDQTARAGAGEDASCCSAERSASWPGPTISALACKGLEQLLTVSIPSAPPVNIGQLLLPEPLPFAPPRPTNLACASRSLETPEPPPKV